MWNWKEKQISQFETLSYYLEIGENEINNVLSKLLSNEKEQMKRQLNKFGNIYIIIDSQLKYASCIPSNFGHNWPSYGMWDGQNKFYNMNKVNFSNLNDLANIEKLLLTHSIDYLTSDNGLFGNINDFGFGNNGHEYYKSFIAESYVYNYYKKQNINPIIPENETVYRFIVDSERILIKTNGKKKNNDYDGYGENSFWKKYDELKERNWDVLYFVHIICSRNKYKVLGLYKIPYNNFFKENKFVENIMKSSSWYLPIKAESIVNDFEKYKINNL